MSPSFRNITKKLIHDKVYVHEKVADEFIEKMTKAMEDTKSKNNFEGVKNES